MSEHARWRDVILPEWLQGCERFVDECVLKTTPRGVAADMWIEHGADMITKIRQLLAERNQLAQRVDELEREIEQLQNRIAVDESSVK